MHRRARARDFDAPLERFPGKSTIASAVEEQSATTASIEVNVAEAAKATAEIAGNITGVAQAAGSTASGASDALKAAQSLSQLGREPPGGRRQLPALSGAGGR